MADIVYEFEGSLYLNITNECPCRCVFCIRDKTDTVGTGKNMWHDKAPTFEQVKEAILSADMSKYKKVVFCGYGEPTCAFDVLVKTAKFIKENYDVSLRVNTNGLGNLINGRDITKELCENVDSLSVSLNAPNSERFQQITRNVYGEKSFDEMLSFTEKCVAYGTPVRLTVVDILSQEEIKECAEIASKLGAKFDARKYIKE